MKITDIAPKKGTRYQIEVDGEYWYILDVELIVDHHLKIGMEVDEAFLSDLKRAADWRKAKERALYLLGYRDHCREELIRKLCRSVDRDIAEEVADRMRELGYLDEQMYARKLAQYLMMSKKQGRTRAMQEMRRRGVDAEAAEAAIEEIEISPDALADLIERRYSRYLADPEDQSARQKLYAALRRLGHTHDDVLAAIDLALERLQDDLL
jgi:regulatory protein